MTARYLVVGAGYAGLAVARRLAELNPDDTVVVVDADAPGENSSGRNSGFMIDLPYAKIRAGSSAAQDAWQIRLMRSGLDTLKRLVDTHHIECGWSESGHYKAAATSFGVGELRAVEAALEAHGVPFRRLLPGEIKAELGTAYYRAAIWLRNCVLVQPAELVNGLIGAMPANVTLYFNTPVRRLAGSGPYRVRAGDHDIHAESVVLCVNAQLPEFGYARYRQLAVYTYAALSRRLSPDESAMFGEPASWGVTPVERVEATSRKMADRFMLRAEYSYGREAGIPGIGRQLAERLRARYPHAPQDLFEHVWGGAVSLTRNGDPVMGCWGRNIYGLSGCNASGILKMTALGRLLAERMAGMDSSLLRETDRFCRPTFIPPDPVRRLAVAAAIRKLNRQVARP